MSTETGCDLSGAGTTKESGTFQELQQIRDAQERLDKALEELAGRIEHICREPSPQTEAATKEPQQNTELSRRIDVVKTTAFGQVAFVNSLIERIQL